jgi:hypothetical protein
MVDSIALPIVFVMASIGSIACPTKFIRRLSKWQCMKILEIGS